MTFEKTSHKGKVRQNNEDYILVDNNLFILADGLGGLSDGEIASKLACEKIRNYYIENKNSCQENRIQKTFFLANQDIIAESERLGNKMGTTAILCAIEGNKAFLGHIGDSRAYLLSDEVFHRLTKDQTVIQKMIDNKTITKEDAWKFPGLKSRLYQCLGQSYENIQYEEINLKKNDIILICSDGLTDMIDDKNLFKLMLNKKTINETKEDLFNTAMNNGGIDNISIILIKI